MPELPNRLRLRRHADLLVLDVELVNLRRSDDGARLERADPAAPARLIVHLPSQHALEAAAVEVPGQQQPAEVPPVPALAAGPSRLAFDLPEDLEGIALTAEGLLGWDRLVPRLAGNALPPDATDGPRPAAPPDDVTAIELPARLLLSPDRHGRWEHRCEPVTHGGRTELWQTRLRGDGSTAPVRAVGRRPHRDALRSSLSDRDLDDIVLLSSDFGVEPRSAAELGIPEAVWVALLLRSGLHGFHHRPVPLAAEELALSALGGSARLRGSWDDPAFEVDPARLAFVGLPAPSLQRYEHVTSLGRDQLVRVVRRGYLHTGHRASLVKVTERRFQPRQIRTEDGRYGRVGVFGATAVLRQHFQVVIQEPVLHYGPLSPGYPHGGREMPLRSLRFLDLATPMIDFPGGRSPAAIEADVRARWIPASANAREDARLLAEAVQAAVEAVLQVPSWIEVGGRDHEVAVEALDWEGRPVAFTTPLLFVPQEAAFDAAQVRARFTAGTAARRTRPLRNQAVALADPTGSDPGTTAPPTESLTFDLHPVPAGLPGMPARYRPRWVLGVTGGRVHVEAVERLTGSPAAVAVRLTTAHLEGRTDPAGVFAELTDGPLGVAFPAERGGGLARPDSTVSLLSTRQGAMASAFAGPSVQPAELAALFGGATLFGTVPLSAVLAPVEGIGPGDVLDPSLGDTALRALLDAPGAPIRIPALRTRTLVEGGRPAAVEARYVWKPELTSTELGPLHLDLSGPDAALVLDALLRTPLDGSPARSEVRGELRDVSLSFAGAVRLHLDRLAFSALDGRKPDITAEGFDLAFLGPLRFVDTLREVLPSDGFGAGSAVAVTPEGITAGYSLGIPTVGVGIFSLQDLSLSAALAIPFHDRPASFRFAISERHKPFLVTVTMFGGGGFFAIEVSADGLECIEAAIEFGGSLSLDLGVASGGVYVMAGLYFGLKGDTTTLTGYLRCGGHLSVLGLVSISVEFHLAFTYLAEGGRNEVWGQARLTVCVQVACFSKSVSLTVERRLAGAAGDPTFDQVVDPGDWERYCLAFAPTQAVTAP